MSDKQITHSSPLLKSIGFAVPIPHCANPQHAPPSACFPDHNTTHVCLALVPFPKPSARSAPATPCRVAAPKPCQPQPHNAPNRRTNQHLPLLTTSSVARQRPLVQQPSILFLTVALAPLARLHTGFSPSHAQTSCSNSIGSYCRSSLSYSLPHPACACAPLARHCILRVRSRAPPPPAAAARQHRCSVRGPSPPLGPWASNHSTHLSPWDLGNRTSIPCNETIHTRRGRRGQDSRPLLLQLLRRCGHARGLGP